MGSFAVIGMGKFGSHVAQALFEQGHEIIAIDNNQERVQEVQTFTSQAIMADVTRKEVLRTLGLPEMDAVIVSTGDNVSQSILATLYLKELGVKRIIVKCQDEDHGKILEALGATDIIFPEKEMALKLARSLSTPNVLDFLPMMEEYALVEVSTPRDFIGKSLGELNLRARYNVFVIAVKELVPDNFVLLPPASFVLKDSDIMLVIGREDEVKAMERAG